MQIGSQIGEYRILGKLGEGGMGIVWRAHHTKLGRDVALKTLPGHLSDDPQRLERLTREAGVLASLNHPNVAAIYEIEELDGDTCLVLELVDGETLEDVLRRGPIPMERALRLAAQLAAGVAAAHEKGIIHRDLKPANIKVTSDGRVKILDFGIAKTMQSVSETSATITADATLPGTVLGTVGYMSPEQARGEPTDAQSDVWAFGLILYEMLAGTAAFRRPTTAETFASLLHSEPNYDALPQDTPPAVRHLIRRCLHKERRGRLRHMGDVELLLEDALADPGRPVASTTSSARPMRWRVAAGIGLLILGVAAGWGAGRAGSVPATPLRAPVRLTMRFPTRPTVLPFGSHPIAIAHDGTRVAFTGGGRVWVRRMDRADPEALHESDEVTNPTFSADGQWIAVFGDGALEKIPVAGGAPVRITATSDRSLGATWLPDDTIVFATTEGLFRVPASGGEPQLLVKPDRGRGEVFYGWPQQVPGRRAVLFTIVGEGKPRSTRAALFDLDTLAQTVVLENAANATFASGRLVFASGSTLRTVAFDPKTGVTQGEATTHEEVAIGSVAENGAANFAIADNGTLLFAPRLDWRGLTQLVWTDRSGRETPVGIEPQQDNYPRISPDGSRIAVDRSRDGNRDVWIIDLRRLTETQLTDGPTEDLLPFWSPDGARVWFASDRSGNFDIYSQPADGTGPARLELAAPEVQMTQGFTPDGRTLLVYDRFRDMMLLPLTPKAPMQPLLANERFDERLAQVSPDGRWIAYESDESGNQFEIMVRSFPDVNARREKVSLNGGRYPAWSPKGDELYYVDLEGAMMAVPVTRSPSLALGRPAKLFDWRRPPSGRTGMLYDVSPKDGRFLFAPPVGNGTASGTDFSVILNWSAGTR